MNKTFFLNLVVLLVIAASAQAATRLVPDEYATIQAAIDASDDGDTVIVADGTYTGEGNRDIEFPFPGGPHRRRAITVRSENGPENCIIDCNGTETELHRGFYFYNHEGPDSLLEGFTITNGRQYDGGGIKCRYSSPTIKNCIICGNVAPRDPHGVPGPVPTDGGGIYCSYSSPTIINCHIVNNTATSTGGAIYSSGGNALVHNCVITGNRAVSSGGAIKLFKDNMSIQNCVISNNMAILGAGGGIRCSRNGPTVTNSILWDNLPQQISGTASVSYSDVQGTWAGEGNIDADSCFVEPGYWDPNGTPENTWDDFWVEGDYRLLEDSPCIDAGDPNYTAAPNETDIDGEPRVINGRIDMGADEYNPPVLVEVEIEPRTLNLASKGKWITCHIWLGEDYDVGDIDPDSVVLEDEIGAERLFLNEVGQFAMARFGRSEVQDIVEVGEIELTVSGRFADGTRFEGRDTIRIIARR